MKYQEIGLILQCALACIPVWSQEVPTLHQAQIPLERLLNEDGSFRGEMMNSGVIDPRGFRTELESTAEPLILQMGISGLARSDSPWKSSTIPNFGQQITTDPDDAYWDDRFSNQGTSGVVFKFAISRNGILYAAGGFSTADGIAVNNIAKWDGFSWSAVGSGTNGLVDALAIASDGTLYAGGSFTMAGGVAVNNIAKWDGFSWSAVGSGMNGQVDDLAIACDGTLYAGGSFTMAGGVAVNYIAKWDGFSWSAVGSGMNNLVSVLAIADDGALYAGGGFTISDGIETNRIAKWDGSSWSALGSGTSRQVFALAVAKDGTLYAGGFFTIAGGVEAHYIAKWDGSSWSALGSGMNEPVFELAVADNGTLYAGGGFITAGNIAANRIAKWDGSAWSSLGSGISNHVYALAIANDGALYVGGIFTTAGDKFSYNFGIWHKDEEKVFRAFTFAHITDVHLGWEATLPTQGSPYISIPPYLRTVTAYEFFTDALQDIIDQNTNPDFLLITGDIVESAKNSEYYFKQFKLALAHFEKNLGHEIPVYVVPGNHDRYERSPGMDLSFYPGNEHLNQCCTTLGRPDSNNNAMIFPGFDIYNSMDQQSDAGLDWYNYSLKHNDYLFIGLDSGADADWYPETTPEGGGLHNLQIAALQSLAKSCNMPKIIFLHHPIFTGDKNGDNASIAHNRQEFISYCKDSNVRLVLSGHTHKDHEHSNEGTLFSQTPSVTKDDNEYPRGYRIIQVENEATVTPLPYRKTPKKEKYVISTAGPVHLSATDSQGRYTGFGSIIVDIPDSYYTGYQDDSTMQTIILYNVGEDYKFQVTGAETGHTDIGFSGKNLVIKIPNLPVSMATLDHMHLEEDSTFVYTTNDQEKDFSISLAREFEDRNRVFIVSNSSISNTDSLKFKIVDNQSLKYINIGGPHTYRVRIVQVGVDSGVSEYAPISIGKNESQLLTPQDWQNLNSSSINLEVDRGNDGSIDSTIILGNVTSVKHKKMQEAPQGFELFQAYPNPFNSEAIIQFNLPHAEYVFLRIFNMRGEQVRVLLSENRGAGMHTIKWDGRDGNGIKMSSGIYFYGITAGSFDEARKMLIVW